jgi:hypothetical protein
MQRMRRTSRYKDYPIMVTIYRKVLQMCEKLSINVRVLCFQTGYNVFRRLFAGCICTLHISNQIEVFATEIETLEVFFVCLHHFMYCSKMPWWPNAYRSFVAFACDTFCLFAKLRKISIDIFDDALFASFIIQWN